MEGDASDRKQQPRPPSDRLLDQAVTEAASHSSHNVLESITPRDNMNDSFAREQSRTDLALLLTSLSSTDLSKTLLSWRSLTLLVQVATTPVLFIAQLDHLDVGFLKC